MEITIDGLTELLNTFADAPQIVKREYDAATNVRLNIARRKLSRYPAERPGQRYRRTYKLRDGWSNSAVQRSGDERILSNPTPYAGRVQDRDSQAAVHQGRGWVTVQDMAGELDSDELGEEIAQTIARKLGRG